MISTKGRYALRIMIDLAEHMNEQYVPLKEIAQRQSISKKYLESIVKELVAANLISAANGRSGGYKLCRDPKNYTIWEILNTAEGTLATVACLAPNAAPCDRANICKTLPMWVEFDKMVYDYFAKKTLADLL